MRIISVVAVDESGGIARAGKIPWFCAEDLQHFKNLTTGHIVVMGRKTFTRVLPNRLNCIITKSDSYNTPDSVLTFDDPLKCVLYCAEKYPDKTMFVIGGAEIYKWFVLNNLLHEEYITGIPGDYKCDQFYTFSSGDAKERLICLDTVNIKHITHHNQEERAVLNLMDRVLRSGVHKSDRTMTGTVSLFGHQLRFSLKNNKFPLMTSRRMFLRGIFEELMLFCRGQTDSKILEKRGVAVWQPNTTRAFLDSRGLQHYREGDMGHTYGFSMRHFGASYRGCGADYDQCGYDQLSELVNEIKTNPDSRRLMISLWEPNKIKEASLPPCLYNYQFYVADGELSCMMTQRSSDLFTAAGWNTATGALFTILLAHITGLKPSELIWNIGDAHVYSNLLEQQLEQLQREPYHYPYLVLVNSENVTDICDFQYENLKLIGYECHPAIKTIINA